MSKIFKVIKDGWRIFRTRKIVTFVVFLTVLLVSLFVWSGVFLFYFTNQGLKYVEQRLDFSVYFKADSQAEETKKLQAIIENLPQIDRVIYVSKNEAFQNFQSQAQKNPVIAKALNELKINPLVDYLVVKAKTPEAYKQVADYIDKSPYRPLVEFVTYAENQKIIERFISISKQLKLATLAFLLLIVIFGAFIIFTATLIAIYAQKEEIEILRLIGASDWFIRMPFFVFTIIVSLLAYIFSFLIVVISVSRLNSFIGLLLPQADFMQFILNNFWILNVYLFGFIILMNLISTFVAMKKYLKT
jgi:cell division transport system permease protein